MTDDEKQERNEKNYTLLRPLSIAIENHIRNAYQEDEKINMAWIEERIFSDFPELRPEPLPFRGIFITIGTVDNIPSCAECGSTMVKINNTTLCPNCAATSGA